MPILRALGTTGVVAIYDGPDDGPYDAPLSYLASGRVKFHSSLAYPKVIDERAVTLSLPARTTGNATYRASYNLFAHGRGGFPWVLASFRVGGQDVAAVGSVPVQKANGVGGDSAGSPWARWVSIGATATQVTAFEYCAVPRGTSAYAFPAISIPITVWVTDELF